jgi:hypothetical protein
MGGYALSCTLLYRRVIMEVCGIPPLNNDTERRMSNE